MTVCLVTGGAGLIGSHLVEALLSQDNVVRVLDNLTTGKLDNLARVMPAIELYPGDLADLDFVRQAVNGAEVVFHLAGTNDWPDVLPPAAAAHHADVIATQHVLRAACEAKVRRVLYASSLRVYGQTFGAFCREDQGPQPLAPEGIAKLLGERACLEHARDHGLETVCLRYFNVFGPRQLDDSPYAAIVRQALPAMLSGRAPALEGDGLGAQDLIYVGDVVHATLFAANAPRVSGKAYNVGRGRPTTGREVVAALNAILGAQIGPTYAGPRFLDDLSNLADSSLAEMELGFCAGTDLEQGLRYCVEALSTWRGRPHLGQFNRANRGNL